MILVDSSVWIDFFNGEDKPHVEILYQLLGKEIIMTGDLIAVEVLQGFQDEIHCQKAKHVLEGIPFLSLCNKELSMMAAENYRTLRKNGVTIRKTIDVLLELFVLQTI